MRDYIKILLVFALPVFANSKYVGNYYNNVIEEDSCNLSQELLDEIHSYEDTANKIINSLINGKYKGGTYKELAQFVDKFGARVSGTENLENAIDYALNLMTENDLENVHGEDVDIPHWVRNYEYAELLEPRQVKLPVLGLGGSVSTPAEGIEAEAIVVTTFDQLKSENVSKAVKGKIVIFNEEWAGYGASVQYRSRGNEDIF